MTGEFRCQGRAAADIRPSEWVGLSRVDEAGQIRLEGSCLDFSVTARNPHLNLKGSARHVGAHRILSQLLQTMLGLNEVYGTPAARGRIEGRDSKRILRRVETVPRPASGVDSLVYAYG